MRVTAGVASNGCCVGLNSEYRSRSVIKRDSPGYPECNRSEDVIAAIPFMAYGLDLYSAMAPAAPRRSF